MMFLATVTEIPDRAGVLIARGQSVGSDGRCCIIGNVPRQLQFHIGYLVLTVSALHAHALWV